MSVNRYKPHVMVLPEDDANRQIANGFVLEVNPDRMHRIQVLPAAGGWNEVLKRFEGDHVAEMAHWQERFMVLVLDLDGQLDRVTLARDRIPAHLRQRVFIVGVLTQPEALKPSLGTYETIGAALARDCRDDTSETWGHNLIVHNADEMHRLRQALRPLLFG